MQFSLAIKIVSWMNLFFIISSFLFIKLLPQCPTAYNYIILLYSLCCNFDFNLSWNGRYRCDMVTEIIQVPVSNQSKTVFPTTDKSQTLTFILPWFLFVTYYLSMTWLAHGAIDMIIIFFYHYLFLFSVSYVNLSSVYVLPLIPVHYINDANSNVKIFVRSYAIRTAKIILYILSFKSVLIVYPRVVLMFKICKYV